ncbi:MAG: hypothetical protein R6V27_09545 [Balneolaceae bacterium]
MRFIADLNNEHLEEINKLIDKKRYNSVAQFISVAIENQLYLESTEIDEKSKSRGNIFLDENRFKEERSSIPNYDNIEISIKNSNPETVNPPENNQIVIFPSGQIEDCWLWGQINRIFPIKLGLKVLLSKLKNNAWIGLNEFKNEAAVIAGKYRQMIDELSSHKDLNKREIAAGLPIYPTKTGDNLKVENSMNRYKNQFLAFKRYNDEKLSGALIDLRFANVKSVQKEHEEKELIGITEAGLKFAKLFNPIMNKQISGETLSGDEKDFYINHIRENHIGEYNATIWMLEKLKNGFSSRSSLNEELEKDYNNRWNLKKEVVNTQRAGLTARMTELGLIDKIKKGITVKYLLSEYGKEILKNK